MISRCRPTASGAELLTAMAEVKREGIPHVHGSRTWRERTLSAKNAGSEYLNHQFGWVPIVNEVKAFAETVGKSAQIQRQYDADRGKIIRRRYEAPVEESTTEVVLSNAAFPAGITADSSSNYGTTKGGQLTLKSETFVKRWFSGAFTYGIPNSLYSGTDLSEFGAKADRLYGLSLTPDVLWNLAPWSWAVDWFTNTGDVIATASDYVSQGLVMQYGYVMEHSFTKYTYSLTGCVFHDKPMRVPDATVLVESKLRRRGNPFGFGVTWDGLSPSQIAIAGALGLSRSR